MRHLRLLGFSSPRWNFSKYLLMLWLTVFLCPVFAAEYFVSATGNDSNTGTISSPYKTITKAVSVAVAGDTIYLRGGQHDYSAKIAVSKSGSVGNPITLRSYQDEVPVLDFTATSTGTRGIELTGSYWVFYDFVIQYAGDNGLYITGTNNHVELLITRWNEDSGIQLHTGAAYNLILNCDSYENYDPAASGENADGFATKFGLGLGNILRGCRSWNNSDDGYDCWNTDPPSQSVTYDQCWAFRNGIDRWGVGSGFNGDGNGFKLGEGAGAHLLINCLAYDNPHNGIDVNGNTSGVHVYNCTAMQNGTVSGVNFRFDEHNSAHVLRNNLSYPNLPSKVVMYDEIDDLYNSWNGFTIVDGDFVSLDSTGIDGPRQADGSLPDLQFARLSEGSAAIDAGVNVGLPYEGTAPDLGAYEYSGAFDYPPAAPTGLSATAGYERVTLDWNDNGESDLAGYNIYRAASAGGPYTVPLNGTLLAGSDYTDTDVNPNTTYYYVVTAVDSAANESVNSGEDSASPMLYGDFVFNGIVEENDLAYLSSLWLQDDCQLTAQIDSGGDCIINYTEFSAFARNWKIPDAVPPAAPMGLSAAAGDGMVTLDWNDNGEGDLDGYNIYRSTASGSGYSKLNGTLLAASDFVDNMVSNGTTYYYVVTAVDTSANESVYSDEDSATPNPPITSITIQENQTGLCDFDGTIDSDNTGFTGDGFINTPNGVGNGIDYRVTILTAGTYTFVWRYANGSSGRPANLIINGTTEVSAISFPATGGWTTWVDSAGVEVTLTAEVKEIRLEATSSGGLANIDYMQVTGPNLEAAACP